MSTKRRSKRSSRNMLRSLYRRAKRMVSRLIACSRGRHRPNRGGANYLRGMWHSRCKNCGTKMLRQRQGQWVVKTAEELDPAG